MVYDPRTDTDVANKQINLFNWIIMILEYLIIN